MAAPSIEAYGSYNMLHSELSIGSLSRTSTANRKQMFSAKASATTSVRQSGSAASMCEKLHPSQSKSKHHYIIAATGNSKDIEHFSFQTINQFITSPITVLATWKQHKVFLVIFRCIAGNTTKGIISHIPMYFC